MRVFGWQGVCVCVCAMQVDWKTICSFARTNRQSKITITKYTHTHIYIYICTERNKENKGSKERNSPSREAEEKSKKEEEEKLFRKCANRNLFDSAEHVGGHLSPSFSFTQILHFISRGTPRHLTHSNLLTEFYFPLSLSVQAKEVASSVGVWKICRGIRQ